MIGEKRMNKLIIASHGTLSEGLVNSAQFIIGKLENVDYITAYVDPDTDYEDLIKNTVANFDYENGSLIVATDIVGGSVNSEFTNYLHQYPFYLVSGVNLVTVISLATMLNGEVNSETVKQTIEDAQSTIVFCNELINDQKEDF